MIGLAVLVSVTPVCANEALADMQLKDRFNDRGCS